MKKVKPPKKPLIFYYGITIVIILLLNSFIFPLITNHSVKEVDYGTFLTMVDDGKVKQVEIDDNTITFKSTASKLYKTGTIE
ncbi:ATP-dependent metallopeptidase FtsH/Yme1/Tma family protein, partial [Neobacillus drentensis]|uniref:ATP-dependent metallopeptidase FtsH/Yme1/Tma family protein n=1 Tax=Neobacillus drentensis TaxID=220684 RepID=UPI002FFDE959